HARTETRPLRPAAGCLPTRPGLESAAGSDRTLRKETAMAQVLGGGEAFEAAFSGSVLRPGHPDYDASRSLWNAQIDRRPAVIARCSNAQQVAAAIRFARESGLEIAVRGGGHNYAGNACCDD